MRKTKKKWATDKFDESELARETLCMDFARMSLDDKVLVMAQFLEIAEEEERQAKIRMETLQ